MPRTYEIFQKIYDGFMNRFVNPVRERLERERNEEWRLAKAAAAARLGKIVEPSGKARSVKELAHEAELLRRAEMGVEIAAAADRGAAERAKAPERLRAHGRVPRRTQPKVDAGLGRHADGFHSATAVAAYYASKSRS